MHHTLRFYGRYQHSFLRIYMSLAALTGIPLVGGIFRNLANFYGRHQHSGNSLTVSEAEQIIDAAENISLGPCSCRKVFHNCDNPVMSEIVLGMGQEVYSSRKNSFKTISKKEAKEVIRQAHQQKLTQSIMECSHHFYAICNCCACCCVPIRLRQKYGIGSALTRNPNVVQEFINRQL